MDFNSSFFENIIGIMIGSFISVITTIVVQLMNFKQEKKKDFEIRKNEFYDELLSKISIDTTTSIKGKSEQDFYIELSNKWLEKKSLLLCFETRAALYCPKKIISKMHELYDIANLAYINIIIPNLDEKADSSYLQDYANCLNSLIELIEKEIIKKNE